MTVKRGGLMDDLISRKAAIDAVNTALFPKINTAKDAEKALRALPSAQPETHEEHTETHSCDCISRQAAIRWVKTECNPYGKPTIDFESGKKVIEHLKQMPSIQPDSKELSFTHKALDTISRQAAIDAHYEYCNKHPDAGFPVWSLKILEDLPPAQPEHTSNNDCNGCKFVGCYNTDFPCANCIRKNKDYYAPERKTDGN